MSNTPALPAAKVRERAERRYARALDLIERVSDLLILNAMWLLCCAAVLPAFAATAALHGVTQRWARGEDIAPLRAFREELRASWGRATALGLLWTAAAALLVLDVALVLQMGGVLRGLMGAGLALLSLAWLLTTCWLGVALQAGHGGLAAVRSAAALAWRHPVVTLAGAGIALVGLALIGALPALVVAVPAIGAALWSRLVSRSMPRGAGG